jgi:hypothetical protein
MLLGIDLLCVGITVTDVTCLRSAILRRMTAAGIAALSRAPAGVLVPVTGTAAGDVSAEIIADIVAMEI